MEEIKTAPAETRPENYVPWTLADTWLGLGILVVVLVGLAAAAVIVGTRFLSSSVALVLSELILIVPIIVIFAWKGYDWKYLGFIRFKWSTLALGCGVMIIAYSIVIVHNLILAAMHIPTQGDTIVELISKLGSPVTFFFVGGILAPLVEETFFRGFLFAGFRQRYGWIKAMLLSSALFSLSHLEPAALIPTFILGCVLAYVYHRSNSVWPGMILHFLVNGFAILSIFLLSQFSSYLQ